MDANRNLSYGYIFARCLAKSTHEGVYRRLPSIGKLCKINGIEEIAATQDSNGAVKDYITIKDSEVQMLIGKERSLYEEEVNAVKPGDFVMIRDGACRFYCGHVKSTTGSYAVVNVRLFTKTLFIRTPRGNLKVLPDVPPEKQVFYYSAVVDKMAFRHEDFLE